MLRRTLESRFKVWQARQDCGVLGSRDLGFRDRGLGFRDRRFRVKGQGFGRKLQDLGCRA